MNSILPSDASDARWRKRSHWLGMAIPRGWGEASRGELVKGSVNRDETTLPETSSKSTWAMEKKKHGCLGYTGDYTTQLCGDYNERL